MEAIADCLTTALRMSSTSTSTVIYVPIFAGTLDTLLTTNTNGSKDPGDALFNSIVKKSHSSYLTLMVAKAERNQQVPFGARQI